MDRSRKASREGNEATLQHRSRKEALLIEQLVEERLAELQASLERWKQTPEGLASAPRFPAGCPVQNRGADATPLADGVAGARPR